MFTPSCVTPADPSDSAMNTEGVVPPKSVVRRKVHTDDRIDGTKKKKHTHTHTHTHNISFIGQPVSAVDAEQEYTHARARVDANKHTARESKAFDPRETVEIRKGVAGMENLQSHSLVGKMQDHWWWCIRNVCLGAF